MPKVLIADKLSPAAVAIFQERGVDADVKTGLPKEELLKRRAAVTVGHIREMEVDLDKRDGLS